MSAESTDRSPVPAAPHPGSLAPDLQIGVPSPADPGHDVPAVAATRSRDPGGAGPAALRTTSLAVPGHPDGEVDVRRPPRRR